MLQTFAPTAIPDLVMVLVEVDELVRREAIRGTSLPAFAEIRVLAFVHVGVFESFVKIL